MQSQERNIQKSSIVKYAITNNALASGKTAVERGIRSFRNGARATPVIVAPASDTAGSSSSDSSDAPTAPIEYRTNPTSTAPGCDRRRAT